VKIVFTGGGTGGHFYPIIAVAEAVHDLVKERKLLDPELYFYAPAPFDERALYESGVTFVKTPAGKVRHYFSLLNVFDVFKTIAGSPKPPGCFISFFLTSFFPKADTEAYRPSSPLASSYPCHRARL